VVHVVALLKSYMPDVDPELLRKEYRCKDDDKWDTLIEDAFDVAQHEYDFSVANDQDSPSTQS
jgi:hypothetical protein